MDAAETAKVFAALGYEGRLVIFRLLASAGAHGMPAGEVARRTGQLQNTTSNNLSVLANAGLVSARRDGRSILYAVTHTRFSRALEFVADSIVEDQGAGLTAFFRRLQDACAADDVDQHREALGDRDHDAA